MCLDDFTKGWCGFKKGSKNEETHPWHLGTLVRATFVSWGKHSKPNMVAHVCHHSTWTLRQAWKVKPRLGQITSLVSRNINKMKNTWLLFYNIRRVSDLTGQKDRTLKKPVLPASPLLALLAFVCFPSRTSFPQGTNVACETVWKLERYLVSCVPQNLRYHQGVPHEGNRIWNGTFLKHSRRPDKLKHCSHPGQEHEAPALQAKMGRAVS